MLARNTLSLAILGLLAAAGPVWGQDRAADSRETVAAFTPATAADRGLGTGPGERVGVLAMDRQALAGPAQGPVLVEGFPLPDGSMVDLRIDPMPVLAPLARIVVVDDAGERDAGFDPASIAFWRGTVEGYPGSHVFLSVAEGSTIGRIELGAGRPTYGISSSGGGVALGAGRVVVYRARAGFDGSLAPHFCGVGIQPVGPVGPMGPAGGNGPGAIVTPAYGPMIPRLRMVRVAVEADYAMSTLFETEREALTYLVRMYAIVSDIFVRDTAVRLDLVSLRLWTTPDHPYSGGVGRPVVPVGVVYDVAQLMSGRKDAPSGGLAYGICARDSWVGYGIGHMGDPDVPNVFNQDIAVAAHEFAHSLGTGHTHDYGIDRCATTTTPPRRGTIMSYCATTFTGGSAMRDMHFHTGLRQRIRNCVSAYAPFDCNQNGIDDALDIASGRSQDADGDGIPDECQDCNGNGILDSIDIATGTSLDLNMNGIPDECEPDCNGNGIPDDLDIAMGFSLDLNGDGIPDECQADLDGNGVFDWVDIFNDMSLDIDRDGVLDAYQDCNGDGVPDIIALGHAHNTWTADMEQGLVVQHHFRSGVPRSTSAAGSLSEPTDVLVTPDRRVLVASAGDARIALFALDGSSQGDLVPSGAGGLAYPTALAIAPDGSLLVADRDAHAVRRYDIHTGAALGEFVPSGSGGLRAPYAMVLGPSGNLFVGTNDAGVFEYDARDGSFVRQFVAAGAGGLGQSRGILFIPGAEAGRWRFLVADMAADAILEFDAQSGAPVGPFHVGTWRGRFANPWGLRLGPDGLVYATIHQSASGSSPLLFPPTILSFDARTGAMFLATVAGVDAGVRRPTGFAFVPGEGFDCNANGIPDACDIASGFSMDRNGNGIPDECEDLCPADCDGDGALTIFDFLCFALAFDAGDPLADCNGDGVIDVFDFVCFQNQFASGCP